MKKRIRIAAGVLAGNAVLAMGVAAFIVPHGIIMGGATGIGITITHYLPGNLSAVIFFVNAVLFVLGTALLGKTFAVTTMLSTFVYPLFLAAAQRIPCIERLTGDTALAALYGGLLLGIGVGLIIRQGASTGGTDIIALILSKYLHGPVAVFMYIVDFTVLGTQIFFSDSDQSLFGILTLIIMTAVMNQVILFGQSQIQLFIVSERYEEIKGRLLEDLDAGVTLIPIETAVEKARWKGLLCIIPHRKLYEANEIISRTDDKAFTIITRIKEVKGLGFSTAREQGSVLSQN